MVCNGTAFTTTNTVAAATSTCNNNHNSSNNGQLENKLEAKMILAR
jgi:hypothetical protein